MKCTFLKEKINNTRQEEIDLAKGMAIIFMVWVHVNEYYQGNLYYGGTYNRLVEFLGSPPAAPVFMMLLGAGIIYSRNNRPRQLFMRGIKLFIMGYLLSFTRDMIPYFLLYKRESNSVFLVKGFKLLCGIDILQFAGLAFIFFAFVRKYNLSKKTLFFIWCVLASLNMLLNGVSFSNHFANSFFGLFWGTTDYSWFPFFNWITYPMVGYVFGGYLIHCADKKIFYKNILFYSALLSIPLWIYSYLHNVQFGAFGELWQQAYYHHEIVGNMVMIAFALFWVSIFYFISPIIPGSIKKRLTRWSKNINGIYSVSYIILGFSILILTPESYPPIIVCCLAVIIFTLTDLICFYLYKKK